MADPYATDAPDLTNRRPGGPPPWLDAVLARGGAIVSDAEAPRDAEFHVVHCRGVGTLAPVARLDPPLAVLLWLEHLRGPSDGAAANRLLARLREDERPTYALKQGYVGGPPDRPGCLEIDAAMIDAALDAAVGGEGSWEVDPDFGYQVLASVPGLDDVRARALLPRLLYADHDRVYEHASLVAAKKRERHALAEAVVGLSAEIVGASGWPPPPAAGSWRE